MKSHFIAICASLVLVAAFSACSGPAPNSAVGNPSNGNAANALDTKSPSAEIVKNNAPTLTPVFKAYCEASKNEDEKALRKIYSSDTIKNFEEQMKEHKIKTLIEFLEDDKVTGELCEVINEEITGDTAVATIRSDRYRQGLKIEFVKENGEWKLTNKAPGSITQQPANTK